MTLLSANQEVETGIPSPPSAWWRQRRLFISEAVGLIAIVAGVIVVLAPWSDFIRGLIGGALLGLGATMIVGALFSARDGWEQHQRIYQVWQAAKQGTDPLIAEVRAENANAFYLGVDARMLTANKEDIADRLEIAKRRCEIAGIAFSDKENKLIARSNPTLKEAAQISDLLVQKAQQRGPQESTFFNLGQLVGAIVPQLERSRPIQPTIRRLEFIYLNQFIQLDSRFKIGVATLLRTLSGFDETASGEARKLMIDRVLKILNDLPTPEIETYGQSEQGRILEDEWYWTQDETGKGIPICFSAGYVLTALGAWDYEISRDTPEYLAKVKSSDTIWNCSMHPEATEDSPCFDIQIIFDHTNSGTPVTEARTILVRYESLGDRISPE
jgi:hypothetical protein